MKSFAVRLICLHLGLVMMSACSDNAGQSDIKPTPYTLETAEIDPALQPPPQPVAGNPAEAAQATADHANTPATDMPDQDTPQTAGNSDDKDLSTPLALNTTGKVELTDEQWRAILSTEEYDVLRRSGTENAFTGRYLNNKQKGAYYCVGCGNKLYDAQHKFHSGCGWPSFFQEIEPGSITTYSDRSLYPPRTEMRCARCDGHLGHVFADAPDQPTGLRHCVNGTALIFVPEGADIKQVFREHRAKFANK